MRLREGAREMLFALRERGVKLGLITVCSEEVTAVWAESELAGLFDAETFSVDCGLVTCHWHHARFDLASGCTFDLWADDVPTCPAEVRDGEVWVRPIFGYGDPAGHLRQRR